MVAWSGLQQWWKTYYCKRLKEVLEGPAATSVLTSGHVLLTCGIGAVLLIAQLLLQQWPSNFFGFCMLSPLLAAVMLGGACLAAFPGSFGSLAVVLGVATLGLTAWQSVLGGIFHQLPLGDSRALFTLVNTLVLTVGIYLASKGSVPRHLRRALLKTVAGRAPEEPVEYEAAETQTEPSEFESAGDEGDRLHLG